MMSNTASRAVLVLLAGAFPFALHAATPAASPADASISAAEAVQSTWKAQEIQYSYMGFTTAYNCDAFETKLKSILKTLGAHPQTKVRASGCDLNRPARNFFVRITTAVPVAAGQADEQAKAAPGAESRKKLLDRLGVKETFSDDPFPAQWKTVDLANDRKLNLQPGDCELMDGLVDHVLPKLAVKVISNEVRCMPKQLSIQTPELKVSALVALPSADEKQTGS